MLYAEIFACAFDHHAGENSRDFTAQDIGIGTAIVRSVDALQDAGAVQFVNRCGLRVRHGHIGNRPVRYGVDWGIG